MAVGRHDPTRKTIYLDQSTISDAFLATEGRSNSDRGYAPLRDWIERVAHEANLCLSTAHLVEVARFPEIVTGDRIVLWLESLPTVWVRPADDIAEDEDEVWTKFAAASHGRDGANQRPMLPQCFNRRIPQRRIRG